MKRRVICFVSVIAFLFASCEMSQEYVKEYLEYWTSTIQVVSQEIVSPYIRIGGVDNVSAEKNTLELYIYLINPNKIEFESNFQLQCNNSNLTNFKQEIISSDSVKITAALDDSQEGKEITLSGYIQPSNKKEYGEANLKESNPELFYSCSFIQNTPPDAVSNLIVSKDKINNKYYVCFNIPDQSKKKNQNISYRINYYLLESDGTMKYKGTSMVSPEDNKNTDSSKFYYYFDEQEDLLSYDYTVQVVSSNSLTSEVLSTNSNIGICQACEADISFSEEYNGFTDNSGFEIIEVKKGVETITCNIKPGADGESIYGKIDDTNFEGNVQNQSLDLGEHIITVTTQKDYCRNVVKTKKIKVVQELQEPGFGYYLNVQTDYSTTYMGGTAEDSRYASYQTMNVGLNDEGQGYLRVMISGNTQNAQITLKDGNDEFSNGDKLFLGPHTITVTVSKENYKTKVFTKKVYIQGMMNSPSIECTGDYSDIETIDGINYKIYKYDYINYDKLIYKPKAGNANAKLDIYVNEIKQDTDRFELNHGDSVKIKVIQSNEYCKPITFVENIKAYIKPVKLEYSFNQGFDKGTLWFYIEGFGKDSSPKLKGKVTCNSNCIWEWSKNGTSCKKNSWTIPAETTGRYFSAVLNSPDEKVRIKWQGIREDEGDNTYLHNNSKENDQTATERSKTLEQIKKAYHNNSDNLNKVVENKNFPKFTLIESDQGGSEVFIVGLILNATSID